MIATSYGKTTASGSGQGLEFLDGRRGLASTAASIRVVTCGGVLNFRSIGQLAGRRFAALSADPAIEALRPRLGRGWHARPGARSVA
jgi:hypothetical protein